MPIPKKSNKTPSPLALTTGLALGLGVAASALFQENASIIAEAVQDIYEGVDWKNVADRAGNTAQRVLTLAAEIALVFAAASTTNNAKNNPATP